MRHQWLFLGLVSLFLSGCNLVPLGKVASKQQESAPTVTTAANVSTSRRLGVRALTARVQDPGLEPDALALRLRPWFTRRATGRVRCFTTSPENGAIVKSFSNARSVTLKIMNYYLFDRYSCQVKERGVPGWSDRVMVNVPNTTTSGVRLALMPQVTLQYPSQGHTYNGYNQTHGIDGGVFNIGQLGVGLSVRRRSSGANVPIANENVEVFIDGQPVEANVRQNSELFGFESPGSSFRILSLIDLELGPHTLMVKVRTSDQPAREGYSQRLDFTLIDRARPIGTLEEQASTDGKRIYTVKASDPHPGGQIKSIKVERRLRNFGYFTLHEVSNPNPSKEFEFSFENDHHVPNNSSSMMRITITDIADNSSVVNGQYEQVEKRPSVALQLFVDGEIISRAPDTLYRPFDVAFRKDGLEGNIEFFVQGQLVGSVEEGEEPRITIDPKLLDDAILSRGDNKYELTARLTTPEGEVINAHRFQSVPIIKDLTPPELGFNSQLNSDGKTFSLGFGALEENLLSELKVVLLEPGYEDRLILEHPGRVQFDLCQIKKEGMHFRIEGEDAAGNRAELTVSAPFSTPETCQVFAGSSVHEKITGYTTDSRRSTILPTQNGYLYAAQNYVAVFRSDGQGGVEEIQTLFPNLAHRTHRFSLALTDDQQYLAVVNTHVDLYKKVNGLWAHMDSTHLYGINQQNTYRVGGGDGFFAVIHATGLTTLGVNTDRLIVEDEKSALQPGTNFLTGRRFRSIQASGNRVVAIDLDRQTIVYDRMPDGSLVEDTSFPSFEGEALGMVIEGNTVALASRFVGPPLFTVDTTTRILSYRPFEQRWVLELETDEEDSTIGNFSLAISPDARKLLVNQTLYTKEAEWAEQAEYALGSHELLNGVVTNELVAFPYAGTLNLSPNLLGEVLVYSIND